MGKITAVYSRVSSRSQDTESQDRDLRAWVDRERVYPEWYSEAASGKTMNRPEWQRLWADVLAGKVLRVVVWRLDRLGRTAAGLCKLFDDLREHGVGLLSLRDGFDLETPGGRLQAGILASVAQFEREIREERTRAGLEVAREKVERARSMAADGISPESIAQTLRISLAGVKRLLGNCRRTCWWGAGLKDENRDNAIKKREAGREKLVDMMDKGLTLTEAARALGISRGAAYRRLQAANVHTQTGKRADHS